MTPKNFKSGNFTPTPNNTMMACRRINLPLVIPSSHHIHWSSKKALEEEEKTQRRQSVRHTHRGEREKMYKKEDKWQHNECNNKQMNKLRGCHGYSIQTRFYLVWCWWWWWSFVIYISMIVFHLHVVCMCGCASSLSAAFLRKFIANSWLILLLLCVIFGVNVSLYCVYNGRKQI